MSHVTKFMNEFFWKCSLQNTEWMWSISFVKVWDVRSSLWIESCGECDFLSCFWLRFLDSRTKSTRFTRVMKRVCALFAPTLWPPSVYSGPQALLFMRTIRIHACDGLDMGVLSDKPTVSVIDKCCWAYVFFLITHRLRWMKSALIFLLPGIRRWWARRNSAHGSASLFPTQTKSSAILIWPGNAQKVSKLRANEQAKM